MNLLFFKPDLRIKVSLLLLFFIFCNLKMVSQQAPNQNNKHFCEIEKAYESACKDFPELDKKAKAELKQFNKLKGQIRSNSNSTDSIVPVVFHLITHCENSFEFTTMQLEEAITEVNEDFTAQNTDEYNETIDPTFFADQGDVEITFKLAEIDPFNNPTDGITRSNSFYSNNGSIYQTPLKQIIQWDPTRYLNVWIVENVATSGYAQYPWTAASYPILDGIVMSYYYVGDANINQRPNILTHEIGHWLGLLHTWGDFTVTGSCPNPPAVTYCECDDLVDDTPNCLGYVSINCPADPADLPNSCIDPTDDRPDNVFNFMDYSCEVMFTEDQKTRMLQTISSGIAGRDQVVTMPTDPTVFMLSNPDNMDAKLYLDQVVYTESFENPGTIQEVGVIELRDCNNCSFSPNINSSFTTTGLSTTIQNGLLINYIDATNAEISFDFALLNPADHDEDADITNFSIDFDTNAFIGINSTSDVFNDASISGLKIDFIDNSTTVMSNDIAPAKVIQNIDDGDFAAAYMPYINDYVGFYHYQNAFYMYTASNYQMEAVVTNSGSYNVKRLANNELLNTQSFEEITPGYFGASDELIIYDSTSYTDWVGQTGCVGVRITSVCGETYYAWVSISVTADSVSLLQVGINTAVNGALQACQTEVCPSDKTITTHFIDNNPIYFEVYDWITSTSIIDSNANISYDAANYIELNPGFETKIGANYIAEIEGCECTPNIATLADLNQMASDILCDQANGICNNSDGHNKEFELRHISSGITNSFFTIDSIVLFTNLVAGNDYQYRVRMQCGITGEFGDWSAYVNFTTNVCTGTMECIPIPQASNLSNDAYCDYGYLYCNSFTGDNKEFELVDLSTNMTTTYTTLNHYQYVDLTPNTSYQFRVRTQCGTSGPYGGWSVYHDFMAFVPSKPSLNDLNQMASDIFCDQAYGICNNYSNVNKEYEVHHYYSDTTSSFFTMDSSVLFTGLVAGQFYRYRVRLECEDTGTYGDWSSYKNFTTNECTGTTECVPVPLVSNIYSGEYCDYGYLYCNQFTGDNKEFELVDLSTNMSTIYTTDNYYHYVSLLPETNYQFRVRVQCGTTGPFGGWSVYHSFTTPACI